MAVMKDPAAGEQRPRGWTDLDDSNGGKSHDLNPFGKITWADGQSPANEDVDSNFDFEELPEYPGELGYACVLIPGQPFHILTGDLARSVLIQLEQVCSDNLWILEFISAQPNYLQWGLRVPPSMPPTKFMGAIRNSISTRIQVEFSGVAGECLEEGFWASGYLVVAGLGPLSSRMIDRYLNMVRRIQEKK